jgi:heme-degrading monooxygenase HmoA
MFVCLWEFDVRPESEARFRQVYGADGLWVALFRLAPGFVRTELLRDRHRPGRYLTIDTWDSAESHAAFRARFAAEFAALDREGEVLTARETLLGEFDVR